MAKTSKLEKNKRIARLVTQYAAKRRELKAILANPEADPADREAARKQISKMPRNASPVRYRNRCGLTGRPRGYYRKFKLSRIALRELALEGKLPGVTKSSW